MRDKCHLCDSLEDVNPVYQLCDSCLQNEADSDLALGVPTILLGLTGLSMVLKEVLREVLKNL